MSPLAAVLPTSPRADGPTRIARTQRASGVAVTALLLAAGSVAPDPPAHGGTDAVLLAFYRAHYSGLMTGVFLWALAMMALLLFALALVHAAREAAGASRRDAGVLPAFTVVAALAAAGMLLASQAVIGAAAVIGRHATDAAVVRGIDEISHMLAHVAVLPLGVFVFSAGLTAWRARAGARWVAGFGVACGAALAASAAWVSLGGQGLHNAGVLALFAFMLWVVTQSVALAGIRRPRPSRAVPPAAHGGPAVPGLAHALPAPHGA